MTNWRKNVGALFIVLAMVFGALAGLVHGIDVGIVGVSPSNTGAQTGGQTGGLRLVGGPDATGKMNEIQVDANGKPLASSTSLQPAKGSDSPIARLAGVDKTEITSHDGMLTVKHMSPAEQKQVEREQQGTTHFSSKDGQITVTPTRSGTRSSAVDAGGPYGGPNFFEGSTVLTFRVTVTDPSIVFFRWDFNNDGAFDYPAQTSPGNLGDWTTATSVDKVYGDNYFGDIVVEGWDGVSTKISINTGDQWADSTSWTWTAGMFGANYRMVGWGFQAKRTVDITEIGHYHYVYTLYNTSIYSMSGSSIGSRLGMCAAQHTQFQWNWCTLTNAVTLIAGQNYWVAERIETWTTGFDPPLANEYVANFDSTYGCFIFGNDPDTCSRSDLFFNWGNFFVPTIDFKYRETLILPETQSDTAFVEVHNVAPTVSNIVSSPSPGLEGSPTKVSAFFNDPGVDDTWEFQWTFHDGTISPWVPVTRLNGGAKFLYLHAQSDAIDPVSRGLRAACATFCTRFDVFDFGPLGQNRVPRLDELLQYDVVFVGGRWGPIPGSDAMGNRLADYMDAGGNVIMDHVSMFSSSIWGIGGRWQSDGYAPVANTRLGSIYVPGHPILDGVSSWGAIYIMNINSVTSGATRVADWASGQVAIATKENPIVHNGARAVYLDVVPFFNFDSGDYFRVMANAIRWASRQPDPTMKPMPIQIDSFPHVYKDDDPTTTTLQDTFPVSVTVRDDDDGKIESRPPVDVSFQDFQDPNDCSGFWPGPSTFPPGWSADPDNGWQCNQDSNLGSRGASIYWYYNDPNYGTGNGVSTLNAPPLDLSAFNAVKVEYSTYWWGPGTPGPSDGYVEASLDGGATYPIILKEYHTNNPARFKGPESVTSLAIAGQSNVMLRFRYVSSDDIWWMIDNVHVIGLIGTVINGHGSTTGTVTVANVPPTVVGGFDTAKRMEAQSLRFSGFTISDPALLQPTEWFAYKWNMGDGTPTTWTYKGTMTPPKFKVLVVQSLCISGDGCSFFTAYRDALLALDDVASVDSYNLIQFPPTAPTLARLMQYDVIVYASYWAYLGYPPWDTARRVFGDRLASYVDARRGGVLTTELAYDLDPFYGDLWALDGRFLTDKYGAFGRVNYVASGATLSTILEPDHDALSGVRAGMVTTNFFHGGKYPVTIGGKNAAAGIDGQVLANWDDGTPAIGVKALNNGMRTAHIGARIGYMGGQDLSMLLRSTIGWIAGGIPTPKITPFTYTYGDNGVYTADLSIIDDDMGYVWDTAANQPLAVLPQAYVAHRQMTVSVDNIDPTIRPGLEAFVAANVCLRVSGSSWGSVSLKMFTDGVQSSGAQVTRTPGSPNDQAKCSLMKIDLLARHTFRGTVDFTPLAGRTSGSNPFWVIIDPWRKVNPGHGQTVFSGTFKVQNPAGWSKALDLPNLKRDLFDQGRGAPVEFAGTAFDPGTDDLAFTWIWDDGAPATVHVHQNANGLVTNSAIGDPQRLGFTEPFFDRAANTGLSPLGTMNQNIRDTAVHVVKIDRNHDGVDDCEQDHDHDDDNDCGDGHHDGRYEDDRNGDGDWNHANDRDCGAGEHGDHPGDHEHDDDDCDNNGGALVFEWVVLIVLDDDNSRGYASTLLHDGTDMEFLVLDLN